MSVERTFSPAGRFTRSGHTGVPHDSDSGHRFGGVSWIPKGFVCNLAPPVLLAVIDFSDPVIEACPEPGLKYELPLFTYINFEEIPETLDYTLDSTKKTVDFSSHNAPGKLLSVEDRLAVPFREVPMGLQPMTNDEIPIDEESYWKACDSFIGGSGFIRVLGVPVFATDAFELDDEYTYVASIGYEDPTKNQGLFHVCPFFPGEFVSYFYVATSGGAPRVRVITQPT